MHFYWHIVINLILFMVSNKILAMQGGNGNGDVGEGKIPDPAGGHLSGEIKYPSINTDPVPSAPIWPGPGPASVYGHGSKEELSADQLSALNLETAQNRPSPAGLPYHFVNQQAQTQQHAAGPFGYGSHQQPLPHQQPHNLMGQLLNPSVAAGPSSSSTNPHFPAQYPPMHHQQQEQFFHHKNNPIEAFIKNNLPITHRREANNHYDNFFMEYKREVEYPPPPAKVPNVYPLSLAQLEAGISQLEILYKIKNAEKISSDTKFREILLLKETVKETIVGEKIKKKIEKDVNYYFSELFYNQSNFWTPVKDLEILDRQKILSRMFDRANRAGNADSTDLIELLVTSTPIEKEKFDCDFKASEVRNHKNYMNFLIALCNHKWTDWVYPTDENYLNQEIDVLHNYYDAYKRIDHSVRLNLEPQVIRILTQYNHSHLRKIFEFYRNKNGNFFYFHTDELMKMKKGKDHFLQTVHAIAIDVGMGRPHFFAMLLAQKLNILSEYQKKGFMSKALRLFNDDTHVDVQRILILRARIDLKEIADAYAKIQDRPLRTELEKIGGKEIDHPKKIKRYIEIVQYAMKPYPWEK